MTNYDFDSPVDRCGTDCMKYDCLKETYGRDDLFPMWIADMDFGVCREITEALTRRLAHPVYGYTRPPESYWQSIIDWVYRRHGLKLERKELAFVPGIVRGMAFALDFFTSPGDRVLIQPPVYHPFRIVPEGTGRVVVENPLVENVSGSGSFYTMDFDGLEEAMRVHRPKMMILCNPHNPCGVQWDAVTLGRVARLAKAYGVIVISDEIHGDLMLGDARHIPFFASCPEATEVGIIFGAPSKTFNIAGLESSWMAIRNPELREPFYRWMEVNEFSSPSFMAWIAAEAAYRHGSGWLDEALAYIEDNARYTERYCLTHLPGIKAVMPEASFLMWLDCRGLGLDQPALENLFLDKAGLALNSGTMFGHGGEGFMRLNIGLSRRMLTRALDRLRQAIG